MYAVYIDFQTTYEFIGHVRPVSLYSVPINGVGPPVRLSKLLPTHVNVVYFRISPDSQYVVYHVNQDDFDKYELYSVPIAGGAIKKLNGLLVENGHVQNFVISPTSDRVVYWADQAN